MIFKLIINILALLFSFAFIIVFIIHILQEMTSNAPFVVISNEVLDEIIKELEIKDGSIVYDLGSGDGRVVFAIAKAFPNAQIIGVERSLLPYIISRFKKYKKNISNVNFIRSNFFKTSITQATHVFIFLFPSVTNNLLPKFVNELKPGARVISCDFPIDEKKPVKIIDLHREHYGLGNKMYVYEF